MQRVAIARAIINEPDIILADEPTGALDTETSVQVMEIIKELSNEKLIIMVTHNQEIAEKYSSRIIRIQDGKLLSDSNPFKEEPKVMCPEPISFPDVVETIKKVKKEENKKKRTNMSRITALSLSLKNLMTKKTRTILTSFAGSIGIIGIALILALSNGIQTYIDKVQEDTLSSYPLTIDKQTTDFSGLFMNGDIENTEKHNKDAVYSNSNLQKAVNKMMSGIVTNDLSSLKDFLDKNKKINELVSDVKYSYPLSFDAYYINKENVPTKVSSDDIIDLFYEEFYGVKYSEMSRNMGNFTDMTSMVMSSFDTMTEMLDNKELLSSQYDIVAGTWPESATDVVLVVDNNNEITDMTLYSLGLKDREKVKEYITKMKNGEEIPTEQSVYTYDEIIGTEFSIIPKGFLYKQNEKTGLFEEVKPEDVLKDAIKIKISGIVRPSENAVASSINSAIGYTSDLTNLLIKKNNNAPVNLYQKEHPSIDVLTGFEFSTANEKPMTMEDVQNYIMGLPKSEQDKYLPVLQMMSESDVIKLFTEMTRTSATYESNINKFGLIDVTTPKQISIYPKDFASKQKIIDIIDDYNKSQDEEHQIVYTDYIGLLMSSVSDIINVISYVLIAFVSISLVVSSIMIGIITYISVLERTKEIGILRAIGASKKDIKRVFNAETTLVGLLAGVLGIVITSLICIPANIVIHSLTGINSLNASVPLLGAISLIVISVLLTLIAGTIPARLAAKKDPVIALRTE